MGAPVMQPARHTAAPALRNDARAHASVLMVLTLVRMVHHPASPEGDEPPSGPLPSHQRARAWPAQVWVHRHTFVSRLVMAGVDLRTVQQLGGRQSLAMVQRYAHLAPDHSRAAVERLVRAPDRVELGQD